MPNSASNSSANFTRICGRRRYRRQTSKDAPLVDEYLATLEDARIPITKSLALEPLPSKFTASASEPLGKLSQPQRALPQARLIGQLQKSWIATECFTLDRVSLREVPAHLKRMIRSG